MKFTILFFVLAAFLGLCSSAWVASNLNNPEPKAKNIILIIGDGMGLTQISAEIYETGSSSLERFPVVGLQKTISASNLITDSAAAATAMACGKKTFNNAIGMDSDNTPCESILMEAEKKGYATGMVVTSSIVHATPAAFVAHQPSRNFYEAIAADFMKSDIDLIIGGGKQFFSRRESDDRDLIRELKDRDVAVYDYFYHDLMKLKPAITKRFAYFTADNQPLPAFQGRDYLPHATRLSLDYLSQRSEQGFFLMIEGSQIDWSCHANQGTPMLEEMKDFDKAVRLALAFAKKDGNTLVVVTADHETGGLAINQGSQFKKLNLAFTTNGHTGVMVPVFAYGPGSELFRGIYDNTQIYFKMKEALGF